MSRDFTVHDQQVRAVAKACFDLVEKLVPEGYTTESLLEGMMKGAALVILANPRCTPEDAAEVFASFADALRQPVS